MAIYITVDGGTTNTRLYLVKDHKVVDSLKLSDGLEKGVELLKTNLKSGISSLLERNNLTAKDIAKIIASGMITSERGLCELTHINVPVGIQKLKSSMYETSFPEISDIKWVFIRGIKTDCSSFEAADIVRGEETEVMGLVKQTPLPALYILPGSHSKHISVEKSGSITDIKTMMSGELFAAVIQNTILKNSTDFEHAHIEEKSLKLGFEFCRSHGINSALFKTRILQNIFDATKEDCFSYLLGVILYNEIIEIIKSSHSLIVIGCQTHFKQAISILLNSYCDNKKIITLSDNTVANSVAIGAVSIYEYPFN